MLEGIKGMAITFKETFKKPVTAQYPKEHMPVANRFMGFPVLTWDADLTEPFCTACMVCIRTCPTQCMSATMIDNPQFKAGTSPRRKIVESFGINYSRCIVCNLCVEVCNFDAIVMSHEHEMSNVLRYGRRQNLPVLLELGKKHQEVSGWEPSTKKRGARATAAAKAGTPAEAVKPTVVAVTPAEGAPAQPVQRVVSPPAKPPVQGSPSTPPGGEGPAQTGEASKAPPQASTENKPKEQA